MSYLSRRAIALGFSVDDIVNAAHDGPLPPWPSPKSNYVEVRIYLFHLLTQQCTGLVDICPGAIHDVIRAWEDDGGCLDRMLTKDNFRIWCMRNIHRPNNSWRYTNSPSDPPSERIADAVADARRLSQLVPSEWQTKREKLNRKMAKLEEDNAQKALYREEKKAYRAKKMENRNEVMQKAVAALEKSKSSMKDVLNFFISYGPSNVRKPDEDVHVQSQDDQVPQSRDDAVSATRLSLLYD